MREIFLDIERRIPNTGNVNVKKSSGTSISENRAVGEIVVDDATTLFFGRGDDDTCWRVCREFRLLVVGNIVNAPVYAQAANRARV
jgi:hypothetical protein